MTRRLPAEPAVRQQGAIPVRTADNGIEILLVTSRGARRWIIPKGWPARHMSPADSAAREAFEEAGVRGHIAGDTPIGSYTARKKIGSRTSVLPVDVFLLRVSLVLDAWPECLERQRGWFKPDVAAKLVEDPELAALIEAAAATIGDEASGNAAAASPA